MKRIIICADGTWNVRDQVAKGIRTRRPTNVTKVARAILPRDVNGLDQVVVYQEGVGTGGWLDKYTGGAFGNGLERNVRELYRFILYNYVEGDELFLFGFSRGAFTVRTLLGFMNMVGLIRKVDDYYIPEIYACYERNRGPGTAEWIQAFHNVREGRRPGPTIKFVGVWDTVGALGPPGVVGQVLKRVFGKNRYRYHDIELNSHIQNAYHALAIDERRKPFEPSLWSRSPAFSGHLEQAWFAGVHTNVGGSNTPDGLANEALHWVVEKAEALGLEFDRAFLAYFVPCFNSLMQDSMTPMYRVFGSLIRPIGQHPADGEEIHQSAIDRVKLAECNYKPSNLGAYLDVRGASAMVCNTSRIPRGTPCAPLPDPRRPGLLANNPQPTGPT
jgi:uncharacterized protein (DUF2235 family)